MGAQFCLQPVALFFHQDAPCFSHLFVKDQVKVPVKFPNVHKSVPSTYLDMCACTGILRQLK